MRSMDERAREFLAYYATKRVADQIAYFRDHAASHGRRAQWLMLLAGAVMALSSVVSALAARGDAGPWHALAILLPAVSAGIVSLRQLYQDERNANRYLATQRDLEVTHATLAPSDGLSGAELRDATARYVSEIEALLSSEHREWIDLMQTVPDRLHPGSD